MPIRDAVPVGGNKVKETGGGQPRVVETENRAPRSFGEGVQADENVVRNSTCVGRESGVVKGEAPASVDERPIKPD